MANVTELRPDRKPLAHFLRVGTTGYRQLDDLLQSGRASVDRAVIDAAMVPKQLDLISTLLARRSELVLETNIAELSAAGRFQGTVKAAPWALADRPLHHADFTGIAGRALAAKIADFAVSKRFRTVLAPTHVLASAADPWFTCDQAFCGLLRNALDAAGGAHVAIDYVLALPYAILRDVDEQRSLIAGLSGLCFENLWIRTSGFGVDSTGAGVRRYIDALTAFIALDAPIIADGVAGLTALASMAFGAAGGVAHGVGEMERFDARGWNNAPKPGGGGRKVRVLVPLLDRQLELAQLQAIATATHGRRLISCSDSSCCPRGLEDMQRDPKQHYLHQRRRMLETLSRVPDARRAQHFLDRDLTDADRFSRQLSRLRLEPALHELLIREAMRIEKMTTILGDLNDTTTRDRRAAIPAVRVSQGLSESQHSAS